ncbi:NACHT domain-containing protein [Cladophialophora immunda]|nr:NACHT domain-containing protein [Cladophialophora immunda]
MRLLQCSETGEFSFKNFGDGDQIPPYAILSHTWGLDTEEVTFEEMESGTGKDKLGYEKIRFCGEQARQDDLQYFWIDTCCIDKKNAAELQHAINSMFRWYRDAEHCYVYLADVSISLSSSNDKAPYTTWAWEWTSWQGMLLVWVLWGWILGLPWLLGRGSVGTKEKHNLPPVESQLRKSKWFTRGWTLQELLAPRSVKFFSKEGKYLGDKSSRERLIHEITAIPELALQGTRLSQFSVNDRFSWSNPRQTKLEEDKAYSLLGIFGVNIHLRYGEGMTNAFERLQQEIENQATCIQHLRLTDPRDDKKRIEASKGGLLEDSYRWILENPEFNQWRSAQLGSLLWIKGHPGKGKTMLLCGAINELDKSIAKMALLSYFFCQATDPRINNAVAVLRGLLYMLVDQQPSLVSHLQEKHVHAGKALFEDPNAWIALSTIFANILQDKSLHSTYLIVDALDECMTDLPKLLEFVVQMSSVSSRVKWIVSSRNWPSIERYLNTTTQGLSLSLELNEQSVSAAVASYIQFKVDQLALRLEYDNITQDYVQQYLLSNAKGTFLWVALVCQKLSESSAWEAQKRVEAFPPGLNEFYGRMLEEIKTSEHAERSKQILAVISAVYRDITLDELASFVDLSDGIPGGDKALSEIIARCGSFLTLRERTITFVHQSAKDFLVQDAKNEIFPAGIQRVHHAIFSRSLQVMSQQLRRDIYGLKAPGFPIDKVKRPSPDPLSSQRYSCVYWIDHLLDCDPSENAKNDLRTGASVDKFIKGYYLYWLEALSLCRGLPERIPAISKLETLLKANAATSALLDVVRDARRFIMSHKQAIELFPLQVYVSALAFSPEHSLIRGVFEHEEPKWITATPHMREWSACLQTLECSDVVNLVAISPDSTWIASALLGNSRDRRKPIMMIRMVEIWDVKSGTRLRTLEGDYGEINSMVFSHDSARLASASKRGTIKVWDVTKGTCLHIYEHLDGICLQEQKVSILLKTAVFSHDSMRLAILYTDDTFKVWNLRSDACLQTLEGHNDPVESVAFSLDSTRLASVSHDRTVKIWDTTSGVCLKTLSGHSNWVMSVALSPDSTWLASGSWDGTVKIWDIDSNLSQQTFQGHYSGVYSLILSPDSTMLASVSTDRTVKIWDTSSGVCLQTLKGHRARVESVAFSFDSTQLASASRDKTAKIWETRSGARLHTLEGHSFWVLSVAFSSNSTQLASASYDKTVKIWDTSSGICLRTLIGATGSDGVLSVAFSPNSTLLSSKTIDGTLKIWDTGNGVCLQTFKVHGGGLCSVAFSHDLQLALASEDHTVKIWDLRSGACLHTLEGHGTSVSSMAFSHDSTRLASASYDKTVKIWDLSSGVCLQTLDIGRPLRHISFEATGVHLNTNIGTLILKPTLTLPTWIEREVEGEVANLPTELQSGQESAWETPLGTLPTKRLELSLEMDKLATNTHAWTKASRGMWMVWATAWANRVHSEAAHSRPIIEATTLGLGLSYGVHLSDRHLQRPLAR